MDTKNRQEYLRSSQGRYGQVRILDQEKTPIKIHHWLAAILLFLMAAIAFVNVLSRYLLHFSFAATEEITINMFVWLTVIGSGIAFERGGQLGMVTLYRVFPKTIKKHAIFLSALFSALLFLTVDIFIIQAIYDELTLFQATSAALGIPVWIYYVGIPIFSIFVFTGIYKDAAQKIADLKNG
jgi:TRAP-type C4-dicarboxylate transport system permease small subunit